MTKRWSDSSDSVPQVLASVSRKIKASHETLFSRRFYDIPVISPTLMLRMTSKIRPTLPNRSNESHRLDLLRGTEVIGASVQRADTSLGQLLPHSDTHPGCTNSGLLTLIKSSSRHIFVAHASCQRRNSSWMSFFLILFDFYQICGKNGFFTPAA